MQITATGVIHSISDLVIVSDKFKKREVILRVDEVGNNGNVYPQYLKIQFGNKTAEYPATFREGQQVDISFNLRGRLSDSGACYTSLEGFKISQD